jgi:uncharacterized protein involved in exopolysaccharide biosynthesis
MSTSTTSVADAALIDEEPDDGVSLLDLMIPLAERWRLLVFGPIVLALLAYGIAWLLPPTFTARTVFLPPQQQQSAAASALANLGALAGLAGGSMGIKTPADQYVALMQTVTIENVLIDRFKLMVVYDARYRESARKELESNTRIAVGKKDGLISVEVDDKDAQRAADIANAYVDELRKLTDRLALTEAQQRRVFFEAQMQQTRDRLTKAQQTLQASGFDVGAIKAEPRAAAEGYARLQAEVTAAEVRLQTIRRSLADSAPEVQQQQAALSALRGQLQKLEAATPRDSGPGADYVSKYREFKYQETLFELFSRQYELARLDESREGALIQVVDKAAPAERRSKPRRALIALGALFTSFIALAALVLVRHSWREAAQRPETSDKVNRLRAAFSR